MVDELRKRLVNQRSLGPYPAQSLCLPDELRVELDIGPHLLHLFHV